MRKAAHHDCIGRARLILVLARHALHAAVAGAAGGALLLAELASSGAPVKVEQNELFDDASPADEGEDVPTAAPAEIHGLKVEVSDAVARLPPESPEKKFATHLVAQAESSAQQNEWEKAQRLYVRALAKCGIQALATPGGSDYDLDELVAGAAAEDADNPLFGDDEVGSGDGESRQE